MYGYDPFYIYWFKGNQFFYKIIIFYMDKENRHNFLKFANKFYLSCSSP